MLTVQTNLKTAPCTRAGASYGITSARTSTNARPLTFARQRAVSNTEALKDVVKVGGDREPAVMPGTPAKSPLPEEEMIRIAREFDPTTDGGKSLADDFEFVAPVIGPLGKEAYLNAIEMFSLPTAFPDLTYYKYSIFVDPFEPHRVWYMTRGAGKHEGLLVGPGGPVKATGKVWEAPPEMSSITINEEGKITSQTTGYVVDRRVGNTGGQGAVFGVLYAIGKPLPPFGSWRWKLLIGFGRIIMGLTGGGKKEMKQEQ